MQLTASTVSGNMSCARLTTLCYIPGAGILQETANFENAGIGQYFVTGLRRTLRAIETR